MTRVLRPFALAIFCLGLLTSASLPTAAADPGPEFQRYVALGDSYTAAPFVPTLQVAGGCYRSTNNYPALAAQALGVPTFVDRSCGGAQTKDMTTSQLTGVGPQFDDVTPDTDLVTVSIGGNDFSVFGTLVGYCPTLRASDPTGAPCRDAMRAGDDDRLFTAIAQTRVRVATVVAQIRERAPEATILVVGYPQITPRVGTCPDLLPLADGDYKYAVQVNQRLAWALRDAATVNHVGYVDVWTASQGHDICAADPWVNGQYTDPTRAASFHPFANEQLAIAGQIEDALD